eukprot:CAMPEP_0195120510 /NCGR_PEP_ID=MMETSP0448-20130528/122018_1 /TAXON_ID=66468 /ORGANISM="Heterocapsa triquestra, Strain CCMP 448" /LENGTH=31 /DNA_ID= /DNA_START= /DNA_END= /DNA_ORIENTATION=
MGGSRCPPERPAAAAGAGPKAVPRAPRSTAP